MTDAAVGAARQVAVCVGVCMYVVAISRDKDANLQADEPVRICFSKWLLLVANVRVTSFGKTASIPKVAAPFKSQ